MKTPQVGASSVFTINHSTENMCNFAVAITVYVRHLQIVVFYDKIHHVAGRWRLYSTLMMCLGYVIAFGTSLVANVQVSSTAMRRPLKKRSS